MRQEERERKDGSRERNRGKEMGINETKKRREEVKKGELGGDDVTPLY